MLESFDENPPTPLNPLLILLLFLGWKGTQPEGC